jgi:hypothetical protein
VPHKVELKQHLLTEYEAEVGFTEQLVQEWVVCAHQLVLDVLEDAADLSQWEDLVAALLLHYAVLFVVISHILDRWHLVLAADGLAELGQDQVAGVDHEVDVCAAALFIED